MDRLIDAGHAVTVVNPGEYLHYPGMLPGYVDNTYTDGRLRINVAELARTRGAQFLCASARSVDIRRRIIATDGAHIHYDVASINVGSSTDISLFTHVELSALYRSIFPTKPVKEFMPIKKRLWQHFIDAHSGGGVRIISVIGGGPAAVEIAISIRALHRQFCVTHGHNGEESRVAVCVFSGGGIMSGHRAAVRRFSARALAEWRVGVRHERITHVYADTLVAADGTRHPSTLTVVATGVTPPAFLRSSGFTVDSCGALHINRYLQSVDSAAVFAAGDCAHFTPHPLPKVGVYAVRQGVIIHRNILAAAHSAPLARFRPQRQFFFSLNIGGGEGIASKYRFTWRGRGAFRLKDRFDRLFIDYYQNQ